MNSLRRGGPLRPTVLAAIGHALARWMFHGRAYAGGRFVATFRFAYTGTP